MQLHETDDISAVVSRTVVSKKDEVLKWR